MQFICSRVLATGYKLVACFFLINFACRKESSLQTQHESSVAQTKPLAATSSLPIEPQPASPFHPPSVTSPQDNSTSDRAKNPANQENPASSHSAGEPKPDTFIAESARDAPPESLVVPPKASVVGEFSLLEGKVSGVRSLNGNIKAAIRVCYQTMLIQDPSIEGTATILFTLQPGVEVKTQVNVSGSLDSSLEKCLASTIQKQLIPKWSNYEAKIRGIYRLSNANKGRSSAPTWK